MNTYLISDTHFFHSKIIQYCDRPPDWVERFQKAIKVVTPEDILIHLGDICIGKDEDAHELFIKPIQAKRKILVRGNHDPKSTNWYLNHGWDYVADALIEKKHGKRILFTHQPATDLHGCDVNIHGHLHNMPYKPWPGRMLVSMELTDYKPLNLEKFLTTYKPPHDSNHLELPSNQSN